MNFGMGRVGKCNVLCLGTFVISAGCILGQQQTPSALDPSKMVKLGTVDPRYVSYNIEMVEVTGGRFWKPYSVGAQADQPPKPVSAPDPDQLAVLNQSLFQYRSPIDLKNSRLRNLATALGPSYLRVSGTWQNSTYFQNDDNPAMTSPPEGFKGVLTRAEWKDVVDFAQATGARIVTSVAISPGTRDAEGIWTPAQAKVVLDYTKSIGGSIAATEFMNEPTFASLGGASASYDAATFAKDVKVFNAFLSKESPATIFLGPGGVGEAAPLMPGAEKMKLLGSEDLMKATGPVFDAFSYHFYGAVSRRCMGNTKIDQALTAEWLNRTDGTEAFYGALRDKYLPGKPLWLTETGEAACGGDEFAGQFIDSFRFLNQLGSLAQKGVTAVMHNTLVASDYGLLNETTLEPKPNYWAALLWKRTMGSTVLNPETPRDSSLRIYAQCMNGKEGGVTLLALNTDTKSEHVISLPIAADRYTLTSDDLTSTKLSLNGTELKAAPDGSIPDLKGKPVKAGVLRLAPASITFLTIASAQNKSCM